jgi:hypothetical protein
VTERRYYRVADPYADETGLQAASTHATPAWSVYAAAYDCGGRVTLREIARWLDARGLREDHPDIAIRRALRWLVQRHVLAVEAPARRRCTG